MFPTSHWTHHYATPRRRDNRRSSSDALSRCSVYDIAGISRRYGAVSVYLYEMAWHDMLCLWARLPFGRVKCRLSAATPSSFREWSGNTVEIKTDMGMRIWAVFSTLPRVGKANGRASLLARQLRHPAAARISDFCDHGWTHLEADPETSLQVSPERWLAYEERKERRDSAVRQTLTLASCH